MITVVDVGATKTLVGQMKLGVPTDVKRFPTPQSTEEFLVQLNEELQKRGPISAISIGVPGIMDNDGTVIRCGILPWKNFPLKKILAKTYNCPVYIENDAKLAALAEVMALSKVPRLGIYITVSTGIGIGVVTDGKLIRPLHFVEAGHMALQFENRLQIWEDFASGKALTTHFGKQAHELSSMEEWDEVAKRLSLGLHALIPTFQPEVIIFGGGVGGFFNHFQAALEKEVADHLSPMIQMPKMRVALHAKEAVLYGCYYSAKHQ